MRQHMQQQIICEGLPLLSSKWFAFNVWLIFPAMIESVSFTTQLQNTTYNYQGFVVLSTGFEIEFGYHITFKSVIMAIA